MLRALAHGSAPLRQHPYRMAAAWVAARPHDYSIGISHAREGRASSRRAEVRLNATPISIIPSTCMRTTAMRTVIHFIVLTVVLRVTAWRPGRVQQESFSCASFWQGIYFPVQICVCTVLCTSVPSCNAAWCIMRVPGI